MKQQLLPVSAASNNPTEELIEMMIAENIPLNKLERPGFVKAIENFGKTKLPSRSTATKMMEKKSKDYEAKIKMR